MSGKKMPSSKLKAMVQESIIDATEPEELSRASLFQVLDKNNFAIIRGLIQPDAVRKAKRKIISRYAPDNDRPATGEAPHEIMDNFQKLSIGGAEHSGVYRPRCMRTFYNPIWAEDIYGMRRIFTIAAKVRNILYGWDLDHYLDNPDDDFWTAARIHHYPSGGGFLVSHVDDVVPVVQRAEGISAYFQPVVVMSTKGDSETDDFETGGGFFELLGERYYYEEDAQLGDIVIYNGSTIHGVADIDLHKTFDPRTCEGRFAAFVTVYKRFVRKGELENYVGSTKTVY